MIYSTNRTTSLGNMTIDVNESYFGVGTLDFMQENAQDELALFEAAIKSDIDEVLIGESATELEALNEGFVQNAGNKIKELMRKFIEWLKAVTRSAIAKLSQLLIRDNAKFIKVAKKRIQSMPNYSKFKYKGKGLSGEVVELKDVKNDISDPEVFKLYYDEAKNATEKDLDKTKSDIEKDLKDFNETNIREDFNKTTVEEVELEGKDAINYVEKHMKILESQSSKAISNVKKKMAKMQQDANKLSKDAEKAVRESKSEDKVEKLRLSVMADAAAAYKAASQKYISDTLYLIKQNSKIARAVVAKAMGASPKNEGVEYSEELIDAMIETANYEYDESLEEMSEGKDCEDCDSEDDIEDEE